MGISETLSNPAPIGSQPDYETAIVGTGFGGLAMAIKLREDGQNSFVVIERGASVGGTWRDNQYPGAACDVPSHLYSFSFAPKADWSRVYPTQPELHAYLRKIADEHRLLPNIAFDSTLTGAAFDEARQLWRVEVSCNGVTRRFTARALVLANGSLAEPKLPDVAGVEKFAGKTFHSSRWDHHYDLAGKRVAVIGSGASAIQFVPEIADGVGHLDVYQRTPNWIIPRPDRPYSERLKALFAKLPMLRRVYRSFIYWAHEARVFGLVLNPQFMKLFQKIAQRHINRQVRDPALKRKVTPDYLIGCRRILISNDWYPAVSRANVDLVTEGIREIREHSIITTDGVERETDCIIFGTGFYATENPIGAVIHGRGNATLASEWSNGEEAYLGTLVKKFPNLFLIVGPNTGVGHTSMVFIIESQVAMIRRLLARLRRSGSGTLEVRAEVQDEFNRRLQAQLSRSVWSTGCKSWYQHRSGKITALWPGFTFSFRRRTQAVGERDYVLEKPVAIA
ncbi:MAG: cyclohexanone monooxygenase [Hydrocarboniphaga sp.]|uniref:flavin-containing monooxygenase n=1 Tax=Hydrocarboniphaga sp. TaxID=2033016 RepID=UPI002619A996|nr:NAD(P)/FAD-dependent oxidoreductase [Hydrocarboniphaga sp.]MDB5968849.1 cyclohexanone monooxygenase [Hydrocarboniphaga sp.]